MHKLSCLCCLPHLIMPELSYMSLRVLKNAVCYRVMCFKDCFSLLQSVKTNIHCIGRNRVHPLSSPLYNVYGIIYTAHATTDVISCRICHPQGHFLTRWLHVQANLWQVHLMCVSPKCPWTEWMIEINLWCVWLRQWLLVTICYEVLCMKSY